MALIITVLMLFVALNCAAKLSLWPWRQRFLFSAAVALFTWWSQRYAVLQSKTQLADLLQNVAALQNMAVIVTIESAVNFGFCSRWLNDAYSAQGCKWWESLLRWYPSLLVFPVMFYLLTQTMFMAVGVDFGVSAAAVAAVALVGLPLLAEGFKLYMPDGDGRVELHVLLSCFVCVLGLISTVTGKIVYRSTEEPVNWRMVCVAVAVFAVLFAAGFIGSRLKWKLTNKTIKSHNL